MDLLGILPEILVCLTALGVIVLDLFLDPAKPRTGKLAFANGLGLTLALGTLLGLHWGGYASVETFSGAFLPDLTAVFFRAVLLLAALLTLMLSVGYVQDKLRHPGEFYSLMSLATLGALFLVSASEMLTFYLSLELLSISSFVLVALRKTQARSAEAAIKYLIFGSISSALMLFGFSLIYGLSGSLNFAEINTFLHQQGSEFVYRFTAVEGQSAPAFQDGHLKIELMAALVLILGGLGYKIAAVPFHLWAPDVYEGAPLPVTAFLSASSKVAGFASLMRILETLSADVTVPFWTRMIVILAVLSIVYGNVVAIAQQNIKRLFAYSSIAHAGYLLMGIVALSEFKSRDMALLGLHYYLLVYVLMNLGAFAVMIYFAAKSQSVRLQDWTGLGRQHPWLGFVLTACLLSLTGLPPFAGFLGKFYLFGAVTMMGSQYLWLVLIGVLSSVVSLYYYARIIRVLFFGQTESSGSSPSEQTPPVLLALASGISLVGILGLFVFPNWVIDFVAQINQLI
ncbi:MAG: NADH-quinone oxidoreductase subunit N [Candidatus Sericytochromatia bacterium]|nr:NADH-quinone oxidoreductase subunit N [Candidatus Sericytochromatia bacterium]